MYKLKQKLLKRITTVNILLFSSVYISKEIISCDMSQ